MLHEQDKGNSNLGIMVMLSINIIQLLGHTAPLDSRDTLAVSIFTECGSAATNFVASLQFFKPFEDVVRKFEISAF